MQTRTDRRRRLRPLLGAMAAGSLVTACLFLPQQEKSVGRRQAEKIEASTGFVKDPALADYVDAIGKRLAAHSKREPAEFQFTVLDTAEPNAFALPGGYVYVTRGLLALTNSEDELACVLGHEIGHVTERHAASRTTLAAPFAIATGLTGLATGIVSPALGRAVVEGGSTLAGGLVIAPYGREQERDADEVGIELAARAGFDPIAMSRFLDTLDRDQRLEGGEPEDSGFLATHPSTPERVRDTARHARKLERADATSIAGDRSAYLKRLDGLLVGPDPAEGVFSEQHFLHPELDFSVDFPSGWQTANEREAVLAGSPSGDAVLSVQVIGEGDDPRDVVAAVEERLGRSVEARHSEIGGRPASRAEIGGRSGGRDLTLAVTWIAHRGMLFQVAGLSESRRASAYREAFSQTAESFRPLAASERAALRETRLRGVRAKGGESVESLALRSQSEWSAEQISVANALSPDAWLDEGQLLKVAIPEPYRSRSPE